MYQFIQLTRADSNKPVWLNPTHLSEIVISEATAPGKPLRTSIKKTSDEDAPIEVTQTPDEIIALIAKSVIRA